jgi:hypothetical protein
MGTPDFRKKQLLLQILLSVRRGLAARKQIVCEELNNGRVYTYISFAHTGHSALLRLVYRFESEKFLIPANQVCPFCLVKTNISKISRDDF